MYRQPVILPPYRKIFNTFLTERDWSQESFHSSDTMIVCHLVSFVMYISGAKFEELFFNISRDIFYWVFYHFSCKPRDVINLLICITKMSLSLK